MRAKRNITKSIDWLLVSVYVILVLMGWLNIYAATYNEEHQSIFDLSQSYGKQMIWIGLAFFLISVVFIIDFRFYETFAYFIYGGSIFLLLLVLVAGTEIKGARSWFALGSFSIQPSEIAKYATALAMCKLLSSFNVKIENLKTRIYATILLALPAMLIILQPDPGSALVYGAFILVMYREGLSGNILLIGVAAIILFVLSILLKEASVSVTNDFILEGKTVLILVLAGFSFIIYWLLKRIKIVKWVVLFSFIASTGYILSIDYIFENILKDRHRDRINELLGLINDPSGIGYNVNQSKIAIGSGGFAGKGFLQGTQTKFDFVPEQSTDFIFCTVGEEWGFIGTTIVIILFLILLFRLIIVAERQRSKFARIYGYCVASIFFFHLAINVGMVIGLAPVIGIPLPFFSYGGSSLWSFTVLLFTFIKLDAERIYILR
jgi:rod shape determining protein RodA